MWQFTIFSAAVLMLIVGIGNILSLKTKGIFGTVLFMSVVYIFGYQTGIIPAESPKDTGIVAISGACTMLMIITNLGTMIRIKRLLAEYKTVLVAIGSLAVLAAGFLSVGSLVFGKQYALGAIPPIAGAIPAAQMIAAAATEKGIPALAGFAVLLCSLQTFVAIPTVAVCLNRYSRKAVQLGILSHSDSADGREETEPAHKLIKSWPQSLCNPDFIAGRLALVAFLGAWLGKITGIPAAVLVLILGVIFTEIGFLEENALQKAGYFNFCMLALLASLMPSFATLSLADIARMIVPLVFFLLLGALLLGIGGGLIGKYVFKFDFILSAALGLCAMIRFPFTMTITNDVVAGMELPEAESQKLLDIIMPKMIISGFVSVSLCSVIIAGFIVPLI